MHMNELQFLRARVDELEEELRQIKATLLPVDNPFYGKFELPPQLAAILWTLYRHDLCNYARLDAVTKEHGREYRGDSNGDINLRTKVAMSKLRKKMRPHDIHFATVWAVGYRMEPKSREKLKQMLEG